MEPYHVKISEKFLPLFERRYQYYGFHSGRGCGKSHGIADFNIWASLQKREGIVVGRQYRNSLDLSSLLLYEDKIRNMGLAEHFEIQKTQIIAKETGSVFNFVGLGVNIDSVRSMENTTIFHLEEGHTISQRILNVLLPTIFRANPDCIFIAGWNPHRPTDAIDKMFRENPRPGSICIKLTHEDNAYWTGLKAMHVEKKHMEDTDPELAAHIWGGEYLGGAGLRCYPYYDVLSGSEFDRELIGAGNPVYGLDFGGSRHDPNAIISMRMNDDKILIERSNLIMSDSLDYLGGRILNFVEGNHSAKIIADSAWPQSIKSLNATFKKIEGAKKGKDSIEAGINWIRGHKILLREGQEELMNELNYYSYDPVTLKPEDRNNHLLDALRYASEHWRLEGKVVPFKVFRI